MGLLDELRALLPHCVQWAFLSAPFLPHICATIEKKLLRPGYTAIHVTSNWVNTTYMTHQAVNNIDNMQNYKCFLSCPFSLESQPHVLIFVGKKELVCHFSVHLDSCLPLELCDTSVVRHYHSMMLQKYLQLGANLW
jgi:hypothetical protein